MAGSNLAVDTQQLELTLQGFRIRVIESKQKENCALLLKEKWLKAFFPVFIFFKNFDLTTSSILHVKASQKKFKVSIIPRWCVKVLFWCFDYEKGFIRDTEVFY